MKMPRDTLISKLGSHHVLLAGLRVRVSDVDEFIEGIRAVNRNLAIQAVNARMVAGREHALEVLKQSLHAKSNGVMLARRLEMDTLLRIACTNQISKALEDAGLKPGINDALVIAVGSLRDLKKLHRHLDKNYTMRGDLLELTRQRARVLRAHHKITSNEIDSCLSEQKLADVLAEHANLLW